MSRPESAKPRGRMTAYSFFVQICRKQVKKDHPEESLNFSDFSKLCGERWRKMTDQEKERFVALAEKDKERYEAEVREYGQPTKKRKHMKDPNAPKRAMSAFFWFANVERPKIKEIHPEYTVGDVAKELGRRWSLVDPSIKREFEVLSTQDRERYQKEMSQYTRNKAEPAPSYAMNNYQY